ncbi:hypothetical protein ABE10_00190, partial [Bacillus toyonensis]|nr:hypothetical protein [Bacillus toyonensis]
LGSRHERVHEGVVAAAVGEDEVGLLHGEPVARGRLVGMGVLRGGGDDRAHLHPVTTDGRGDVAVDVGRGDDVHDATLRGGGGGGGGHAGGAAGEREDGDGHGS